MGTTHTSEIRSARENNVRLFCLPPNCTHVVQPLDVGVFAPVKKVWAQMLKQWKLESKAQNVSKGVFPSLLCRLWQESLTPEQCKSGFRASGIFPLSRDAVAMKLGPSQVFAPSHKESQQDIQSSSCGHSISASPYIRQNLRGYFSGILEVKKQPSHARSNTRIRIEGEVITSDQYLENRAQRKKTAGTATLQSDLKTATAVDLPQSESEG